MIVADTHTLLWWIGEPQQLSSKARATLNADSIGVAMITCFEIARLAERKRIVLTADISTWLDDVAALPQVSFLPLTIEIAVTAARLRDPISDPIDRIIVATALHNDAALLTKDHQIIAAGVVRTIW